MYVASHEELKLKLLRVHYDDPIGGHSGYDKTMHKIIREFFWLRMKAKVKKYIKESNVHEHVKTKNTLPDGLLQPIILPSRPWINIIMDFIKGFLSTRGFDCLWVIIDRYTKYAHFTPLTHSYTASTLA